MFSLMCGISHYCLKIVEWTIANSSDRFFISAFLSTCLEELPTPKITLLSAPGLDTQTLVCTVEDLPSSELTIKWEKNSIDEPGSTDFVQKSTGNVNSAVSVLKVKNTDWDSDAVYTCNVKHGQRTYTKKVTKGTWYYCHFIILSYCYPESAVTDVIVHSIVFTVFLNVKKLFSVSSFM